MKKNKTWLLRGVSLAATVIVGGGLIVGNCIAMNEQNNLDQLLCPPIVNQSTVKKTLEEGQTMSKQIVAEGAVLLKNNNNVLPLSKDNKSVNVFGWASVDWAYGANSSSCSGRVVAEDDKESSLTDLYKAFDQYGVNYNPEIKSMYLRYFTPYIYALKAPGSVVNTNVITLHEPNITDKNYYSDSLLQNAEKYSDTAIVVITRNAGEDIAPDGSKDGSHMRKGGAGFTDEADKIYLDVSCEEEQMLEYVGKTYENVVVVINCSVAMDLSFLNTIPGLDAALQVGFTGTQGAEVIPKLLYGDVTPSGHLVDTFAYDRNSSFAMKSKNGARWSNGGNGKQFFEYLENIYVGYRWYETADATGYWNGYTRDLLDENDNSVQKSGFEAVVQYPFGFGMSYTSFSWDVIGYEIRDNGELVNKITPTGEITFKVNVTNTGDYAAKDVVQIYLTAPYYEKEIEKSYVSLVGYEKTITLEPGKNQIVDVKVSVDDCMSYDCYDKNKNGHTGYELDRGAYQFKLMTDSHNVKKVNFPSTGEKDADGVIEFKVDSTINSDTDKYTGQTVKNLFTGDDAIDGYPIDGVEEGYSPDYLNRSDFADVLSFTGLKPRAASEKLNAAYQFTQAKGDEWDNAIEDKFGNPTLQDEVVWGAANGLKVYEKGAVTELGYALGANYNDPQWKDVLAQITVAECINVIDKSYGTPEIASVGKPKCPEVDGPAQIKCYYQNAPRGTGYPSAVVIAQTWNVELAEEFGLSFAKDMTSVGINGLWGWGTNIHRTPVGGRNWEYYSEDPFISGSVLANAVKGLNKGGRYCYIKHFCMNESEYSKVEGFTFTTEQAYREIYLKPFRMAIEQGDALGIMTSFNRIGAVYSGGSEASITGVVRGEWGFRGSIITDWANNGGYMSIDHQLRAGGDLGMNNNLNGAGTNFQYNANGPVRLQNQMKEAMHHVLYTWLRSQYLNKQYNENPDTDVKIVQTASIESWKWWRTLLIDLDVAIGGALLLWVAISFMPDKKKEEN